MTSLPLPGFWAIAQIKIKILAWIFVHLLLAYSYIIRIPFYWYLENVWFFGIYFEKNWFFYFRGSKSKQSKIRDSHILDRVIWHRLVFVGCVYFKILHSRSLWKLAIFDPKSRDMPSLKRHFLISFSTDFTAILFEDVKLMLNKVP